MQQTNTKSISLSMFKQFVIVIFMIFQCISSFGQKKSELIEVYKVFGGYQYEESGYILNLQDIEDIVQENKRSLYYLKEAKKLNIFSRIISASGGALIGYAIGSKVTTDEYNKTIISMGCGLIIIAIPITIATNNKIKLAVDSYNSKLKSTGSIDKIDMKIGFTQNGIGLTIQL